MTITLGSIIDDLSAITEDLLGPHVEDGKLPPKNLGKIYVIVQKAMMDLESLELDQGEDIVHPQRGASGWAPEDLSTQGMKLVPGSHK